VDANGISQVPWRSATSLVKRRQRMLKPCVSLDIFLPAEAFDGPAAFKRTFGLARSAKRSQAEP
jgi:hypothetical protein